MTNVSPGAERAMALARQGDIEGAIHAAQTAVADSPDDYGLRMFLAALHVRRSELAEALLHLDRATALAPKDAMANSELVRVLIGLGRLDEADQQLARKNLPRDESRRLRAMILARRGEPDAAAKLLQEAVAADPRDHESWGNLGGCLLANGQPRRAAQAFGRALQLRPDLDRFREKMIEAQVEGGLGEPALQSTLEHLRANPGDLAARLTAARLEELLGRPERAVPMLREILASAPDHLAALVALAGLLERQNATDEFEATIERIAKLDPGRPELALMRAQLAFRRGDLEEALRLAEGAPDHLDQGIRQHLVGNIEERLGNSDAAFAAFERMNRSTDLSDAAIARKSQGLRDLIDRRIAITTADWVRSWPPAPPPAMRQPAFLIGFPRSGTTLLDTFLMGHSALCVAEEKPMLQAVMKEVVDYDKIAELPAAQVQALRKSYFATAADHVGEIGERLLVDKYPLGAIDTAIVHRLFPTAKIIFAQRHPCDVVLSCFTTRFQPTPLLVNFYRLEDAAKLYDRTMAMWEQCRASMPLDIHAIKYEELVADPEGELRKLLEFLGLDWDERLKSHEKIAQSRDFINTGSYAQVVQPLYARSVGRWERYREQMAPVLPLLAPWAAKMGYSL